MTPYDLRFDSDASSIPAGSLMALKATGTEAISSLYSYDVVATCAGKDGLSDAQTADLLTEVACLTFWTASAAPATPAQRRNDSGVSFRVTGVISEVELLPSPEPELIQYRLRLVPKLWRSTLNHRTMLRKDDQSFWEFVEDLLQAAPCALTKDTDYTINKVGGATSASQPCAFRLQYRESDFNLLSRHLEHWGAFYYFRDVSGREETSFGSSRKCFYKDEPKSSLSYDPNASGLTGTDAIFSLSSTQRTVAQQVKINSYDPELGFKVIPKASADVHEVNPKLGLYHTGAYAFPTDGAGAEIAAVRAHAISASRVIYRGETNAFWIRPGCRFTMGNHPIVDLNGEFVVTSIEHDLEPGADMRYVKSFTAISYDNDQPYSPPRSTPRPVVQGLIPAMIVGEDEIPAPIDKHGSYQVNIPSVMNPEGELGASPSLRIRMLQASTGPQHGVHLPLHAGAEVLLAFLHGDPDQPVIVGAAPNVDTSTAVPEEDKTKGRIKSRGGILIEFEDQAE